MPDFSAGGGTSVSVLLNGSPGGGVPLVALTTSTLNYGETALTRLSPYRSVIVSNVGTGNLELSGITVDGTNAKDFGMLDGCSLILFAGASCTIEVEFKPTTRGSKTAVVTIADNAQNTPQTVALNGTATANVLSATVLNFGSVKVGDTSMKSVRLTNVSNTLTAIGDVRIAGVARKDFREQNTCGSSLGPKASCTFAIGFTPSSQGTKSANLQFSTNGTGTFARTTISLSGSGT